MNNLKGKLLILNHAVLFLCTSMYLGTGGSLVLFSFPLAPQLTPDNYYLQFVPQIQAATEFFTTMSKLMLVTGFIMLFSEWKQSTRWVPIVTLLALIGTIVLTRQCIFPLNAEMASHIKDATHLHEVLNQWMFLNRIRVACWIVEWACMMWYFATWSLRSRYPQWTH